MEEKTLHNPTFTRFAGTKFIGASKEITKAEYCALRGWTMPENEDPNELGRMVQYDQPEGKDPTPGYDGYVSWSPKFAFDEAYRESGQMNFGHAIEAMKNGKRVARIGWNGKNMYLALQVGSVISSDLARGGIAKALADEGNSNIVIGAHIDMRAADGTCVVGWLASQTDMLAEDWVILG